MNKFFFLIFLFASLLFFSCKKKGTNEVKVDLYLSTTMTAESDQYLPADLVTFLEPLECENTNNALVRLTVFRYDLNPMQSASIEIPLSKVNSLRKKANMLAFEHYESAYTDSKNEVPNTSIFYRPSAEQVDLNQLEAGIANASDQLLYCCGEGVVSSGVHASLEELVSALRDSICQTGQTSFQVVYRGSNQVEQPTPTMPGTVASAAPATDDYIRDVFNMVGDKNTDSEERLASVSHHLSLFSEQAMVTVVGPNDTEYKPEPIADYLNKIALFQSLDRIEIVKAQKNQEQAYFKVKLKEYHHQISE